MQRIQALNELEQTIFSSVGNVAPFVRNAAPPSTGPDDKVRQAGEEALTLTTTYSKLVADNEARATALVQRALNELTAAKVEIEALKLRVGQAEERADNAEAYVMRLHEALKEQVGSYGQPRRASAA
jgi:hypothetical protein